MNNGMFALNEQEAWLARTVHYNACRCARCKELRVNGFAPKTSMELHYDVLGKIEKENTRG